MLWIYDYMLIFFDDPEIYGINAILAEGGRNLEIMETLPYLNMMMFDDTCQNITWLLINVYTKKLFSDISIMKFLSVIIWFDSTDIPVINWQVRFLWSSASFKIEDKHEFSLFHDFSDEFLPNHSYVTYTDVRSLNHMNTKYVKHDWITNATVDHLAARTVISFSKWTFLIIQEFDE